MVLTRIGSCFLMMKINRYAPLSNRNRILIFPSEFSVLPRKISEFFRADSPSAANTRVMRGFYNILNVNNLCLRGISSHCKKHYSGLRNSLFRGLKRTILHPKTGFIASRNGLNRNAECTVPDYVMGYVERRSGREWPLSCRV